MQRENVILELISLPLSYSSQLKHSADEENLTRPGHRDALWNQQYCAECFDPYRKYFWTCGYSEISDPALSCCVCFGDTVR